MERDFSLAMRKGERAALASGASRAAVPRAALEHDRRIDLAEIDAIGDSKCRGFLPVRRFGKQFVGVLRF